MNNEPRKASDVLLSIEDKIENLTKTISVYDMNQKLILDRVNKIFLYIEGLKKEYGEPQQNDPRIIEVPAGQQIQIEENPTGQRRTSRPESYSFEKEASPIEVPSKFEAQSSNKKIPVIQRITDSNGKDLFMADVSIFNEKKEVISKVKTNAAGKWQTTLPPGKYSVNIIKTDSATKQKMEALQEIVVPNSNATITLPTAIIKR